MNAGVLTILLVIAIIYRAWQIGRWMEVGDPAVGADDCSLDNEDFCGALK